MQFSCAAASMHAMTALRCSVSWRSGFAAAPPPSSPAARPGPTMRAPPPMWPPRHIAVPRRARSPAHTQPLSGTA